MSVPDDVCRYLGRPDKWFLGGGQRLAWTPPHPQWLDTLGFWDEAHYYDLSLAPLFTITLLDEAGSEISCRCTARRWQPDRLVQEYETGSQLALTERKTLAPDDTLVSELTLTNRSAAPRRIHLVGWTLHQPSEEQHLTGVSADDGHLRFTKQLQKDEHPAHEVTCTFGTDREVLSSAVVASESGPAMPCWCYTPFYEMFAGGRLDAYAQAGDEKAVVYLALHCCVAIVPDAQEIVTFGLSVTPARSSDECPSTILSGGRPLQTSTAAWNQHFDEAVPAFTCADPFLETYYWYRWYGLHLFTARPEATTNYAYPAVYEGLGYFRKLIAYSAQCHLLETRWMQDPALARGSLLNFIQNQRDDGSFFGHLFPDDAHDESFYHANWRHVWELHRNHPADDFLCEAYDGLRRYVRYFERERDPENSGLYDVWNHYETGQEYMHRYMAVDDAADETHWGRVFRLKGVDATVQLYQTKRTLAKMARCFGHEDEASRWNASAETTRRAVRSTMWDPQVEMFFDVDPQTGIRTRIKAAVCFYPYFTDIVEEPHLPGLKKHLFNPDEFWTPYPVPSSSRDDAYFSALPHWKGQRKNCPWNGRVWPMTNSHVAEAIAQTALRFEDEELRRNAAEFIRRFIRMMFDDGDPDRPNCFEHYNPMTGTPCRYRGVDDYQHSWIVELIIKYVCGIRPGDHEVVVDPFPFDLEHFSIERVPVRGHQLGVQRKADRFRVTVNGKEAGERTLGTALRLAL